MGAEEPVEVADEVTVQLPVGDAPREQAAPAEPPAFTPAAQASPLDLLHHDEVIRTRQFAVIGIVVGLLGSGLNWLLPGDASARVLLLVAIAGTTCAFSYLYFRSRHPETFGGLGIAIGWFVAAVFVSLAVPFFGVFSPAPMLLVLGVYFTGLGSSRRLAVTIYVTVSGIQTLLAGLVIFDVMRDPGIVHVAELSRQNQIVIQLCVHLVLATAFAVARTSRSAKLTAVAELERAVRVVAQREAVLQEAREALDRALQPGRGRFSDQSMGGYQLGALIGRGAIGEVYEAIDGAGQRVAIKLLSQASLGNPDHVERFMRELRTASVIDAPNVVRVLEIGERPVPHLVMERLEGQDLAQIMRGQRGLPPEQAIDLVRQVGAGVTAAGAAGVIHRDLKPQNVFLHRGTWKILDFGVSRYIDHGGTLTTGQVVGTPAYMAPEQARGTEIDHRTDLYSLAAIAYRALTGHPPFTGSDVAQILFRVVHDRPRRPSELAAVPVDVDAVLAIGMAKEPAARFATASELADALAAAIAGSLEPALRERGLALLRDPAAPRKSRLSTGSPVGDVSN